MKYPNCGMYKVNIERQPMADWLALILFLLGWITFLIAWIPLFAYKGKPTGWYNCELCGYRWHD